ncbi:MAG TPA: hypothetical protein PLJ21_03455 [Pseudobdellovibrionaceae bacterium]|nr:hypothetical protein [Pseudobdellovibrionaceae bacterium]
MTTFKAQLSNHKLPRQIADLMHSNQFLKAFSVAALTISILALIALIIYAVKPPVILTLSNTGQELSNSNVLPKAEREIEEAIRKYLEFRYRWTPLNVQKNLAQSSVFIHPNSQKAFQNALANVIRFSTEKQVSQRIYPDEIKVNLLTKIVHVTGDRITSIQGMMAAGSLKLELSFESGDRTQENPWGLYITKEKESL